MNLHSDINSADQLTRKQTSGANATLSGANTETPSFKYTDPEPF